MIVVTAALLHLHKHPLGPSSLRAAVIISVSIDYLIHLAFAYTNSVMTATTSRARRSSRAQLDRLGRAHHLSRSSHSSAPSCCRPAVWQTLALGLSLPDPEPGPSPDPGPPPSRLQAASAPPVWHHLHPRHLVSRLCLLLLHRVPHTRKPARHHIAAIPAAVTHRPWTRQVTFGPPPLPCALSTTSDPRASSAPRASLVGSHPPQCRARAAHARQRRRPRGARGQVFRQRRPGQAQQSESSCRPLIFLIHYFSALCIFFLVLCWRHLQDVVSPISSCESDTAIL